MEPKAEPIHCVECGRELIDLEPDGSSPTRCEDCLGQGSAIADRLSINLNELRARAGISLNELSDRAAMGYSAIAEFEGDGAHELRLTTALRLVQSLGASIDQLTERIYWNPGQVVSKEHPPKERLSGFFLVLPSNVPVFEPAPSHEPVASREAAAAIFGANVRIARERRHLTQRALSRAAGLSKAGLSLIERGIRETSIQTLFTLARSMEVAPEALLDGIAWKPERRPSEGSRARHPGRSLDGSIRRLWNEGKTAREIAEAVGTSPGTVSATVHRLRERGEPLHYRRRPTRAVHERARRRRPLCHGVGADEHPPVVAAEAVDPPDQGGASNDEIALQIGANVARHREIAGLSQRHFAEAAETHFTHLSKIEGGRSGVPQLALILKLAGSLNVRCGLVTAGIAWDSSSGSFQVTDAPPEAQSALGRLGQNGRRARRKADLSQQALSDQASMGRSDLVDFERGARNFRIFTVVRIAGALGIGFDELFAEVATWHIRPLAPPEFLPGEAPTKAERDELLIRLWSRGRGEQEIAEALDLSPASIGPYVRDLRDSGVRLEYRRPPRSRSELLARRRRSDDHETPRLRRR